MNPCPTPPALLAALQRAVPLVPRPFAQLAEEHGLSETEVLGEVRRLFDSGIARRFGAVFDGRRLGYDSALCAARIPEAELEAVAQRLVPHPGITHCYSREGNPSLWFTLTAPRNQLAEEFAKIARALDPHPVHPLPAVRPFKIQAVFGPSPPGENDDSPLENGLSFTEADVFPEFSAEQDREIVRRMQASLPLTCEPYAATAQGLHLEESALLLRLQDWRDRGIIRRVGLVLRHQPLGYTANSLCVWQVPSDRMETVGRIAAASAHVSHCYERPGFPQFPYNLYAMLHARTREEAVRACDEISLKADLPRGRMLWTRQEFKKTSPSYFLFASNPLPEVQYSALMGEPRTDKV